MTIPQRKTDPGLKVVYSTHKWVYTASVYSTTSDGGAYASEPGKDLAGRSGGRRRLDNLEFPHRPFRHYRCALRGGSECRIFPENPALSLVRSPVDRASVCSGDRGRAS